MATTASGRTARGPSAGVRLGLGLPGRTPWTGLSARLRGPWLDRELATGVEPWRSAVHSARSLQITSRRSRHGLARSLERLLERAQSPSTAPVFTAVVALDRPAVLDARPQLERLAGRLRDGAPVSTRGVAALLDLLADGSGPLYSPVSGTSLGRVLMAIGDSLDVRD